MQKRNAKMTASIFIAQSGWTGFMGVYNFKQLIIYSRESHGIVWESWGGKWKSSAKSTAELITPLHSGTQTWRRWIVSKKQLWKREAESWSSLKIRWSGKECALTDNRDHGTGTLHRDATTFSGQKWAFLVVTCATGCPDRESLIQFFYAHFFITLNEYDELY